MKANNVFLHKDLENKKLKNFHDIKNKVTVYNVATFYQITDCFNFSKISKPSLCYIQRFFALVSKEKNFLLLNFTRVANIISSSELNTHSELDVLNAVDEWVSYDFDKRSKFAVSLLSKVRLDLLSDKAMNAVLNCKLAFSKVDGCVVIIKDSLKNRKKEKNSKQFSLSRNCSKKNFSLIFTGGYNNQLSRTFSVSKQVDARDFSVVKDFDSTKILADHRSVYCGGALYVFGGFGTKANFFGSLGRNRWISKSVLKYCLENKTWEEVAEMNDGRYDFCTCALMDQIYIVGGKNGHNNEYLNTCVKFDTKNNSLTGVAWMRWYRVSGSCSVFEGRIIVTGGFNIDFNIGYNYHVQELNTVEAYDHIANRWSSMPNMIERRCFHASAAMRNKLFIIGSFHGIKPCEIYDSKNKRFDLLKQCSSKLRFNLANVANTFSIGSKFVTVGYDSSTALSYDVEKDEWSEETFDVTKYRSNFSCALAPNMAI